MPAPDVLVAETAGVRAAAPNRVPIVLAALTAGLMLSVAVFLTWSVDGHWDYALPRRLEQLVALVVVGVAVAISTVIFQTLTENRILTPSIMGFDALFVLLATTLVFVAGSRVVEQISDLAMFGINTALLVSVATIGYRWVLSDASRGLYTLVLVGVIASTLFTSLSSFMFRVMDPNEFDLLLAKLYASFNVIDTTVLWVATILLVGATIAAVRMIPVLDVLTLGREPAITLGVDHRRTVTSLLMIVACLVSVATALVGPIVFLGLLVANLAYQLTRSYRHVVNFVAASLISVIALVLGQAVLQHVLHFNGTLGSIINMVGGSYFIVLLFRETRT